jgi:hypothetical protein
MFPLNDAVCHRLADLRTATLHEEATRFRLARQVPRPCVRVQFHDTLARLQTITAASAMTWSRHFPGSDQDFILTMGHPDCTWWRIALLASKR